MLKKFIPKSSYARNVITLMTGTGLAQAIPIAISPILTRLYGPEEFGVLGLYMAVVSIVVVLVTGRYELAILLPRQDRDAMNVMAVSVLLSGVISAVLWVLVAVFNRPIAELLGAPGLARWLYWVPASTMLMGIYQSLNYWSNRKSQYKRLAISRTVQSGSASLAQLGSGFAGAGNMGLVGGQITGQLLSTTVLARLIWREDSRLVQAIEKRRMVVLAKKYINFPKYAILAHGFNTASWQIPVMLFSALFNATIAGIYTLTQRVLIAPMALIACALGDVFRQEASYSYIHHGNCKDILQKTFKRLFLISFIPFLVFFFLAPWLFPFVFGQKWKMAGEYAQILTPMFFLKFITSPLSSMYIIAQKQRLELIGQIFLFSSVLVSFAAGYYFASPVVALIVYASVYSFVYIVDGLISYYLALGNLREL